MSEMVELGVRALQQAITDACARGGGSCNGTPEGLLSVNADFPPQEVVRAIISAMREPTKEMLDAGRVAWLDSASDYNRVDISNRAAFEAMIDKALEEV